MQITGESCERGWGLFPTGWPGEVLQFVVDVRKALRISPGGYFQPTPLLPNSTWHGETHHQRKDDVIVIFHLMLPVKWRQADSN